MLRSELERFISEDLGEWDDSSTLVADEQAKAVVLAKEDCVISGLAEAGEILGYLGLESERLYDDGECVKSGAAVLAIQGSARRILQAERLILNFMGRMSGISTLTRKCTLSAGSTRIACTRKTTPGFRYFEKKAVFLGGGDPHRFNLSDSVLIKDNHIKLMGLERCLEAAKKQASFTKKIEIEVEDLDSMLLAAKIGVDIIMFDNQSPLVISKGVELLKQNGYRDRLVLEASGNITPENVSAYASTGVDVISMGSLTRHARWIDFSLEMG